MQVFNIDNEETNKKDFYKDIVHQYLKEDIKTSNYYVIVFSDVRNIISIVGYESKPSEEYYMALEKEIEEDFEMNPDKCFCVGFSYEQ